MKQLQVNNCGKREVFWVASLRLTGVCQPFASFRVDTEGRRCSSIGTVRLRIAAALSGLHGLGSSGQNMGWGAARGPRQLPLTAVRSPAHAGEGIPRERDGVRIVLPGPGAQDR